MSEDQKPSPRPCEECGAQVANEDQHKRWHRVILPKVIKDTLGKGVGDAMTGVSI